MAVAIGFGSVLVAHDALISTPAPSEPLFKNQPHSLFVTRIPTGELPTSQRAMSSSGLALTPLCLLAASLLGLRQAVRQ